MNIRELIRDNDLKQSELAEKLGCSRAAVNQWVSGKKKPHESKIKLIRLLQEKGELK